MRLVEVHVDDVDHSNEAERIRSLFLSFVKGLKEHPRIVQQIKEDHDCMIAAVMRIGEKTDTTNPDYQREKKEAQETGRRMKVDYRRNQILLQDMVGRMVR